jgi:hypothetical protein
MKFIFTADIHIRPDRPKARLDENWFQTQKLQLEFISGIVSGRRCPLVICGDIFHKPVVPEIYKNLFVDIFRDQTLYVIPGQHEIPEHLWKNIDESSFGVMMRHSNFKLVDSLGRYEIYGDKNLQGADTGLYFFHKLIFPDEKSLPPTDKAMTASQLLKEYPNAKWIFCGDQHHGFHYEERGRHVVMAGCMNRQKSDMIDYDPKIWFIDTEKEIVESILIPDDRNMVTDSHIKEKKEREGRLSAFIETVKGSSRGMSLDFRDNVEKAIELNTLELTDEQIKIIEELMKEEV